MTTDSDPLYNSLDASKELGNPSSCTLWRWEQKGILVPDVRICGRKYYRKSTIEKAKNGEHSNAA